MKRLLECSRAALIILAALTLPSVVEAQDIATSFDQLRVLLKPGDTVTVTDATGMETRGKVIALSSSSLQLQVGDMRREFSESSVTGISQRRHASFGQGAKWGLIIGGALGALGAVGIAADDEWDSTYDGSKGATIAGGVASLVGLGAAAGVGISALIRGPRPIFVGRPTRSATLTVQPHVLAGSKSVALSIGF